MSFSLHVTLTCAWSHEMSISITHMMTMTSVAVTLCGQCCRRHVVGQRVVSELV